MMNQAQKLQQAIAVLWPILPGLVGQNWQQFAQIVRTLLSKLEETTEPSEIDVVCDRLFQLFFEYEEADARLQVLLVGGELESLPSKGVENYIASIGRDIIASGTHIGDLQIRCNDTNYKVEDDKIAYRNESEEHYHYYTSPPTVTRYTDIACPARVWVKTKRITVVVRLTVQPSVYSAATAEVAVRTDLPVQVHLDAPAFTVLNLAYQMTAVPIAGDTSPLVFDLAPTTVGHTTLAFDFLQGGNPLRTVTVPIEVTAQPVEEAVADHGAAALALQSECTPPDLVLHIAWHEQRQALEFTLIREGGAWWRTFPPVPLSGDPVAYAATLYQKITTLVEQHDPTQHALFQQARQIPAADVDRRLKQLGQNLWADLIPTELKALYQAERAAWQGRTLLLWSDEPHIPWELLWPYDKTDEDEGPWCATLRLTRWLRRDAQGNGNEGAPTKLDLQALAVLAPTYTQFPNLASAQQEQQHLTGLIQQYQLQNRSPAQATWAAVMDLLEAGAYQWLHVAAHGNFYPQAPDGDSALWLAADTALTPDALVGPAIERHLYTARPGFFFNACEVGRQGWTLTRLGGWANRLIRAGAGSFIGPHWSVRDDSALTFAQTFYQHLLQGATIAEATYQARHAARQTGDPTWLAYSVYAHPNARIGSLG